MLAEPSERVAQRLDEGADFLLSEVQVGLRAFLRLLERRPGELQEGFVVLAERVGGERRKAVAEAGPRLLEGRELVGGCPPLGVELGLEIRRPPFGRHRPENGRRQQARPAAPEKLSPGRSLGERSR